MPYVDKHLEEEKEEVTKKNLVLELEEGESVFSSIKQAMAEHSIKEAKVDYIDGNLTEAVVETDQREQQITKKIKDMETISASGSFKMGGEDMWGNMRIALNPKDPVIGTLISGTAANGLKIRLSFYEY